MKGLLSFAIVAIVCLGISGNVTAQDCEGGCDCQPVRNAVVKVLQMPKKVACEWKTRKPIRTMACKWKSCQPVKTFACKWHKAKPVRNMFKGCGCN